MEPRDWLAFAQALVVAGVAAYFAAKQASIARQQAQTARTKLQLDLFEKRSAVYQGANAFLALIQTRGYSVDKEEMEFLTSIAPSMWLFSEEIHALLRGDLWHVASQIKACRSTIEAGCDSDSYHAAVAKDLELRLSLPALRERLTAAFTPYLSIRP